MKRMRVLGRSLNEMVIQTSILNNQVIIPTVLSRCSSLTKTLSFYCSKDLNSRSPSQGYGPTHVALILTQTQKRWTRLIIKASNWPPFDGWITSLISQVSNPLNWQCYNEYSTKRRVVRNGLSMNLIISSLQSLQISSSQPMRTKSVILSMFQEMRSFTFWRNEELIMEKILLLGFRWSWSRSCFRGGILFLQDSNQKNW